MDDADFSLPANDEVVSEDTEDGEQLPPTKAKKKTKKERDEEAAEQEAKEDLQSFLAAEEEDDKPVACLGVETGGFDVPTPEEVAAKAKAFMEKVRAESGTDNRVQRGYQTYVSKMPTWQSAEDLFKAAKTPINWGIDQLFTRNARILLAAEPKVGKTYIVCTLLLAMAAGQILWDRLKVKDPGPVCVVAGEDDAAEIGRRLHRMCKSYGILMSGLPIHFLPGHAIRLNRVRDQEFIRDSVRKLGAKMVIYDPLSRLMEGDENSKEMVSQVLNPASELAADEGVSVCVVHHLGKQNSDKPRSAIERVRGSSDISSWFSCGLFASGRLRDGRVNIEFLSRVSSRLPSEFFLDVKEEQPDVEESDSVENMGAIRLVARIPQDDELKRGMNEQLIEQTRETLLDMVMSRGAAGLTVSEALVHIGCGRIVLNATLKKLIRDENLVRFEADDSIPDGKVIVPTVTRESKPTTVLNFAMKPSVVAPINGGRKKQKGLILDDQGDPYEPEPEDETFERKKQDEDSFMSSDKGFEGATDRLPGF